MRAFTLRNRVIRGPSRLVALAAVALLAACSTTPDYPPAPRLAATPDYNYIIGPLDTVNIIVWRNPELSMSVPVRPDGKVTFPLVEDLPALGKDPTTLARDVEKALGKYIRDPIVTIIVTNFVGPYDQQIRVIGEAQKPQTLAYRQNMTLLDVMIVVGGLTDFADGNASSIFRTAEGGKLYSIRLRDLVKRGDVGANVDVKPGDILIIPQSWF
jgi:polysaccharide export outer membrane protein